MLALAAEAIVFVVVLHRTGVPHNNLILVCATVPLYVIALVSAARARLRQLHALLLVVGGGVVLQLIALTQQPLTSDDDFRYIWDGRVQFAGIDPYRYAPSAPQLARLHDSLLFGSPSHCHLIASGCTAINRPTVHSVYPPVGQLLFDTVHVLSWGGRGGRHPFQIAAAIGAVAVTVVLVRWLRRTGRPLWLAGIWAWSPVVVSEFGNNAHIDWAAVLLALVALHAAATRRPGLAGALIGAAIAIKVYPILVLPALLRHRPRRVLASAGAVIVLGYLPHVAAVGWRAIGYLPGYLHEEGYSGGNRLLLLHAFLPGVFAVPLAVLLAVAVAWWAYRNADPRHPERTAAHLAGAALLIASPNYGWYATLLIALIVISERWEWLPVALAPTFTYLYRAEWLHTGLPSTAIYAIAGAATLGLAIMRRGAKSPTGVSDSVITARLHSAAGESR